jgi:tetraacyldisaccharide 4'-kinase
MNEIWYGGCRAPYVLRLLALLYGFAVRLRRVAYRRGWLRSIGAGRPVIVVGNLTVGGTGKTPLAIWLIQLLQAKGLKVGAVLRGYGSKAIGPQLLGERSAAVEVGDEALLIRNRCGCATAVGRDRVAAAQLLVQAGVDVIVADDGLQHLRLKRDLEIVVIDGKRGFGNGRLLPAGPLREPTTRLESVALIIQNGGDKLRPDVLRMQVNGDQLHPLGRGGNPVSMTSWAGRHVHAVAAIGNPERFFVELESAGLRISRHPFPDHQPLTAADLDFNDADPVVMTEKDAVKCVGFATDKCWYLPVSASMSDVDTLHVIGRIFMDARLLEILVCPLCKGPLQYAKDHKELICRAERLAFPIRDDVPVMLEEEARSLASDDPLLQ